MKKTTFALICFGKFTLKDIVDCDVGFGIVAATTQAPRIYLLLTPSTVTVESEFLRHPSNSERVRGTQKLRFFSDVVFPGFLLDFPSPIAIYL